MPQWFHLNMLRSYKVSCGSVLSVMVPFVMESSSYDGETRGCKSTKTVIG